MNDDFLAVPLGTLDDYRAAGCDPVAAEINAQIAARHAFNTSSYFRSFGRLPNYVEPRGYTEKIQWRKMFDRNPLFITWCDKLRRANLRARVRPISVSRNCFGRATMRTPCRSAISARPSS